MLSKSVLNQFAESASHLIVLLRIEAANDWHRSSLAKTWSFIIDHKRSNGFTSGEFVGQTISVSFTNPSIVYHAWRWSSSVVPIKRRFSHRTVELIFRTRAKMNNLPNVVNNLLKCCAAPLLLNDCVHSCSRLTVIVQSLLTTINKLVSLTVVDCQFKCYWALVTTNCSGVASTWSFFARIAGNTFFRVTTSLCRPKWSANWNGSIYRNYNDFVDTIYL